MDQEYTNRGYLLPPGCKDLIDALNLKAKQQGPWSSAMMVNVSKLKPQPVKLSPSKFDLFLEALKKSKLSLLDFEPKQPPSPPRAAALPPIVGEIVIPAEITVLQLAPLPGQKPFQIISDVVELGFFVFPSDRLSFEIISKVARKHGFLAVKAAS
jgi:hypothetical protein